MTRLKQREIAAFSQALATLYADFGAGTLSGRVLSSVRGLFDCDFVSFSLVDLRHARLHATALAPLVPDWPGTETHQRHLRSDPAAAHIMRTGEPHAVKMSDFVSLRQYRHLPVYTEVFGRVGCDRRLGFAVQGNSPVSVAITVNRKGRDFSEDDRTLLDLLRPHLLQANDQANAQAYADKIMHAERERERLNLADWFGAGLGEIDHDGQVLWLTPRAEALLLTFFPGQARRPGFKRLPLEMAKRLAPTLQHHALLSLDDLPKPQPLVWQFLGPEGRALKLRLLANVKPGRWQMIMEETDGAIPARALSRVLNLTPREAEVLHWLKQGKTNWEIGTILGVTEKTAGKHLENIFVKLNVENRTAAVRIATEAGAEF